MSASSPGLPQAAEWLHLVGMDVVEVIPSAVGSADIAAGGEDAGSAGEDSSGVRGAIVNPAAKRAASGVSPP